MCGGKLLVVRCWLSTGKSAAMLPAVCRRCQQQTVCWAGASMACGIIPPPQIPLSSAPPFEFFGTRPAPAIFTARCTSAYFVIIWADEE